MITKDYVSYEVAKLLKEKGFDYPKQYMMTIHNDDGTSEIFDVCSQSLAMKWLREKHLLHVYVEHHGFFEERPKKVYYHWVPFVKPLPNCKYQTPLNKVYYEIDEYCDTYEQACENAIKYCLENLI